MGLEKKKQHRLTHRLVAIKRSVHDLARASFDTQLLMELANERIAGVLSGSHFASGEFPEPLQVGADLALRHKDAPRLDDHGRGDQNGRLRVVVRHLTNRTT